jgi:hypothetical protein
VSSSIGSCLTFTMCCPLLYVTRRSATSLCFLVGGDAPFSLLPLRVLVCTEEKEGGEGGDEEEGEGDVEEDVVVDQGAVKERENWASPALLLLIIVM